MLLVYTPIKHLVFAVPPEEYQGPIPGGRLGNDQSGVRFGRSTGRF